MSAAETENQKPGQHRVTYHAVNRTFDRLFRETSLKEMQEVVRRKLGLPENTGIMLSQVRGGQLIDLEDDDDFDAFSAVAHSAVSVEVKVTVHQATELSILAQAPTPSNEEACPNSNSHYEDPSTSSRKRRVAFSENEEIARSPSVDREQVLPPSKRRRSNPGSKPKLPGVNQGNLAPSNDDPTVRTGRSTNSNTSDEDVVMEPSTSFAPPTLPSPPIILMADSSAASDTFILDPDPLSHSPSDSPPAAPPLAESKRKQRKASKAPEEAKNEDKEETTSAKAGEQSGRKKKKENTKAVEGGNIQENVAIVRVEDKTEKKKRKKKSNLDKVATESELPGQEKLTASPVPEFPEQLAKAISGNAGYEYKPEKDVKQTRKGKQLANDKINAQPTSVVNNNMHDKGLLARGRDTVSLPEQTVEETVPAKKKKAKQRSKSTAKSPPTDEKQPERSSEVSVTVAEIIKAKRKNAELSRSASTSELAPRAEEFRSNRSKNPVPRKIPEKPTPIVQASDESDSDDSIKALRLAAQQPYLKTAENKTLPDIDIEEVVRGLSARRLTLDRMMRVDIVGQHKEKDVILEEEEDMPKRRRSTAARAASSDSEMVDEEEDESEDAFGRGEFSRNPSLPPVLHLTSLDKALDVPRAKSSDASASMTEPAVDSRHGARNDGADKADSPSVDRKENAEDSSDGSYPSRTPPGDNDDDPIEPIPSPVRQPSPIQASQGEVHVSPAKGQMKKRGGTASLMSIPTPLAARKLGKSVSGQPVSVHEAAVRESLVKMTTSRTKVAASTLSQKSPSPQQPHGPDAAEEDALKPTHSTQSPAVTPARDQAEDVNVSQQGWTTLAFSSPTEPESSFAMLDQLQSSPEPESDSPLFLPSETQPGFPFSQWRDSQSQGTNDPVHLPHDSEDEDEDEEEEEVAALASVTSNKKRPSVLPTFRSLTQIASQSKMYSSPLLPPSTVPQPKTKATTKKDLYGPVANGYGGESESGSESDEGTSHIPKARRAGKKSL